MALLNMAMMDAAIVCWDAKYVYFNPRPPQMNNTIKTVTGLPNFPSYTSGHSTFSGAAATILVISFLQVQLNIRYGTRSIVIPNVRMQFIIEVTVKKDLNLVIRLASTQKQEQELMAQNKHFKILYRT